MYLINKISDMHKIQMGESEEKSKDIGNTGARELSEERVQKLVL